jgi:hypothetical protein
MCMEYNKMETMLSELLEKKYLFIEDYKDGDSKYSIEIFCSNNQIQNRYQKLTSFPDLMTLMKDLRLSVEDFNKFSVVLFLVDDDGVSLYDLLIQIQRMEEIIEPQERDRKENIIFNNIKSFMEYSPNQDGSSWSLNY